MNGWGVKCYSQAILKSKVMGLIEIQAETVKTTLRQRVVVYFGNDCVLRIYCGRNNNTFKLFLIEHIIV